MTVHAGSSAAERYREDGYLFPVRVLSAGEAAAYVERVAALERAHGHLTKEEVHHKVLRFKPHLRFTWLDALVRHPTILDTVEALLGPDLLVWASSFFAKAPQDPGYVSWHQDSITYGLEGGELVTAWLALTDAHLDNAAMRFVPGSHRQGLLPHTDTFAEHNVLSRGEVVDAPIDEAQAITVLLDAGEMSLHHVDLIHSSPPNSSDRPRIGYAIRYMTPAMRHPSGPASAMLVRGEDRFGHFELEPQPEADDDEAARAAYERAMRLRTGAVFAGTGSGRVYEPAGS